MEKVLSPPWSTDWISAEARAAMKASGIAPPSACGSKEKEDRLVSLPTVSQELECPWCGSNDTEIQSEFGSTACKSLCKCHGCSQPFEYFKTI